MNGKVDWLAQRRNSLEAAGWLLYNYTNLVTQEDLLMGSSENVALTELLTRCEMRTLI